MWVALLALGTLVSGCGQSENLRLAVPQLSGLERVTDKLWVEPGMPDSMRAALRFDVELARRRVALFYGTPQSSPLVVACMTKARARSLGLHQGSAHTVAGLAILLGPHALSANVLTHEYAHAELYARLRGPSGNRIRAVPRWFDEGLACVIGDEAKYSEAHWQEIERRGVPRPGLNELYTFGQMSEAVARYGDTRPDTAGNLHVVYTVAAHEVRGWLVRAGRDGLRDLVTALERGEPFEPAYLRIEGRAQRTAAGESTGMER